jgi:hypothetical protein
VGGGGRTGQALNSALSEKDQQTDDMRKRLKAKDAEVARMREEVQKAAVATQRAEAAAGAAAGAEKAVRYTQTHAHATVGLLSCCPLPRLCNPPHKPIPCPVQLWRPVWWVGGFLLRYDFFSGPRRPRKGGRAM